QRIPQAHHGWIYGLVFSPDGKALASSSPYDTCLWDMETATQRFKFGMGTNRPVFSPDGRLLIAGNSAGDSIQVWDTATGQRERLLRGHVTHVNCVALSGDGKIIASGGPEGLVRLWDVASGQEIVRQQGHQAAVRSVAFAPNGLVVATASGGDHTVRIWGAASGALLRTMEIPCKFRSHLCPTTHATSLAFAPDSKTLLCSGGGSQLFDVRTGQLLQELPGSVLAFSPD